VRSTGRKICHTPTVEIRKETPTMEIRETHLLVSADVEMMFSNGHVENFRVSDITCVWKWDETSRETAEYWAAFDYIAKHWTFDWFSIKSWTGSLVKKEGNLYEGI